MSGMNNLSGFLCQCGQIYLAAPSKPLQLAFPASWQLKMSRGSKINFTALILGMVFAFIPIQGGATVVISGTLTSEAGNNGNPAVQQTVTASGAGTYNVGPLSGPQFGDNGTQGSLVISNGPSPMLAATATGFDDGHYAVNGAFTYVGASYSYGFTVNGPQPNIAVPVFFAGSTSGSVTGVPDTHFNDVGTRMSIAAIGIANTFGATGGQTGTPVSAYASDGNHVGLGWGLDAFSPVNYVSYDAAWAWGAILASGQTGTVTLSSTTFGGVAASSPNPANVYRSGTTSSMIDPYIYIDPVWLTTHPGYSITVDAGVGNSAPVPEPASFLLFGSGLSVIAFAFVRRNKTGSMMSV